jgi:hypothetical protein
MAVVGLGWKNGGVEGIGWRSNGIIEGMVGRVRCRRGDQRDGAGARWSGGSERGYHFFQGNAWYSASNLWFLVS